MAPREEDLVEIEEAPESKEVGLAKTAIEKEIVEHQIKKEEEHWLKAYWRPSMGWLYMAICAFDFIIFPAATLMISAINRTPYAQWKSMSLDNGGMIHLAFGAILGVAAWSRGQEKIAGK